MTDSSSPPSPDRLLERIAEGATEEAKDSLARLEAADADVRKRAIRTLREQVDESASAFDGLAEPLATFLNDDERAVRLLTAKLFVALARSEPAAVRPIVDALAARSADDGEFYYVRARCAEAIGYVALDHPDAVDDPELLADLRVGLSFAEPEVQEKLAKALAYVAIGDPSRLRHQVASLAEHLDADAELVRYFLCTALVAIGCDHPSKLADARDPLGRLLDDESPYVRGRAAEALGLLARVDDADVRAPSRVEPGEGDAAEFVAARARFLDAARKGEAAEPTAGDVGTLASIRGETEAVVEAMTASDDDCPRCGHILTEGQPPVCPNCGAPL